MLGPRSLEAHAKVNLSLEIVGRRTDGFHDLVSVMQTVTLADHLRLSGETGISMDCSDPTLDRADNLVLRAANLVRDRFRVQQGCHIRLDKRIPHAAGLGGGSSDAAAALLAVTRLWGLTLRCEELVEMAAELGSDVPFFLFGGTALIEGRGERIEPLPPPTPPWYLLVKPPIEVPTRDIFAALSPEDWTDGARTRSIADSLRAGGRVEVGVNGLQQTLFRLYPEARTAYEDVRSRVEGPVIVSGSGPTIVALFSSEKEATSVSHSLAGRYWTEVVTQATPGGRESPCG